jgi:tetratricopeptide (TPR) repeat protein
MDYRAIYARILQTVDQRAYLTPTIHVDASQRAAMQEFERTLQGGDFDPRSAREMAARYFKEGRIDRVMMLSALHVIACHPRVADWEEAARLVGEQEYAALEMGGPRLQDNLASVERHRGVLAFLRGHYEVALDYFSRTLERQRSAENLQNILCTLLKLDEEDEAIALLAQIRRSFPSELVDEIDRAVQNDPDLALLRSEAP